MNAVTVLPVCCRGAKAAVYEL
ncbi:hypothetical protein NC652_023352 [Populus alba x Populus x berolinensis]|nr:hypothetical protein NC652_023352 [Populus alba x Populus x berolinensis]